MPSTSTGRPSSAAAPCDVAVAHELADARRGDVLEQRDRPRGEAEALEEGEVARRAAPEAEVLARDDRLGADRPEELVGELLRLQPGDVERELDDERLVDSELREQLQPALEGHQQLDPVSERGARVRIERDDRRLGPCVEQRLDHAPVPEMDAVEGSERDAPAAPQSSSPESCAATFTGARAAPRPGR